MTLRKQGLAVATALAVAALAGPAGAQLTDQTQTPNSAAIGIKKPFSGNPLTDEVGTGRGDLLTPLSSLFIIGRDPARSIRRGRQIFQRKFTRAQGNGPRTNDGIGTTLNQIAVDASLGAGLADSCAACHGRPKGSAGAGGDVVTRPDSRDAPHLFGLGLQEQLGDEITTALRAQRNAAKARAQAIHRNVTVNLIAKGIKYGSLVARPDGTVDTAGVQGVNPDLRIRPFFAQGGTISIREFLVGAFNAEMGLEAPDPDLFVASTGGVVVTPSGMILDGSQDAIEAAPVVLPTQDSDGDGVVNEIPTSIVDHEEFYLLHYFKAGTGRVTPEVTAGRAVFADLGCTSCHIPNLTIDRDRRVADVETVHDPVNGNPLNRLFATASLQIGTVIDDGLGFPTIKRPARGAFVVRNFFADLKRHNLGPNFAELNYDDTLQTEMITEALWGVGTTAPYGHDGRSHNLEEVILRHGGEAQKQRDKFAALSSSKQRLLFDFLNHLILFPPDDIASNLLPKDTANPRFPQRGHGAIALTVLFNNPADVE